MNSARFNAITGRYHELKIAVFGDFCLDRYLEIALEHDRSHLLSLERLAGELTR